jgi:hypothetical protein
MGHGSLIEVMNYHSFIEGVGPNDFGAQVRSLFTCAPACISMFTCFKWRTGVFAAHVCTSLHVSVLRAYVSVEFEYRNTAHFIAPPFWSC